MSHKLSHRFDLLDGLRGIAALAVMSFHFTQHNGLHWVKGGAIAVDLFFVLSGFIITHSYRDRILAGMSFADFFRIRYLRLYPMYFVGFALGLVATLISILLNGAVYVSWKNFVQAFLLGLFGLPYLNNFIWPFGAEQIPGSLYPFDGPAWSLFFEFFVNIIFFLYVTKFRVLPSKTIVAMATAVYVVSLLLLGDYNPGWGIQTFLYGFPRVVSEFFLGSVLYELKRTPLKFNKFLTGCLLLIMFAGFFIDGHQSTLVWSFVIIPMAIMALAERKITGHFRRVCMFLGDISYPLYIIHLPIYLLAYEFSTLHLAPLKIQFVVLVLVAVSITIVSTIIDKWFRKKMMVALSGLK